jgi:hypothetical protein
MQLRQSIADQLKTQPMLAPVEDMITAQFLLQLNAKMRLVLKDISRNNMDRALKQYYGLHLMVADVIQ